MEYDDQRKTRLTGTEGQGYKKGNAFGGWRQNGVTRWKLWSLYQTRNSSLCTCLFPSILRLRFLVHCLASPTAGLLRVPTLQGPESPRAASEPAPSASTAPWAGPGPEEL